MHDYAKLVAAWSALVVGEDYLRPHRRGSGCCSLDTPGRFLDQQRRTWDMQPHSPPHLSICAVVNVRLLAMVTKDDVTCLGIFISLHHVHMRPWFQHLQPPCSCPVTLLCNSQLLMLCTGQMFLLLIIWRRKSASLCLTAMARPDKLNARHKQPCGGKQRWCWSFLAKGTKLMHRVTSDDPKML